MAHKEHGIWATARTEYVKWVTDPRMILVAVLLVYIYQVAVEPLLSMAEEMEAKLNLLEPFIAVSNSPVLMLMIPLVFLTLISDFPRTDGNSVFFIQRIGRTRWLWGQLLFVLMAMATYIIVLFLGTTIPVLGRGEWSKEWSIAICQYKNSFPHKSGSFGTQLITGRLYNQIKPIPAALLTYLLQILYLLTLSLVLMWFWMWKKKVLGIFVVIMIVGLGTACAILEGNWMWLFPMAHTNVWLHYTVLLRKLVCPFWVSGIYLAVPVVGLSLWNHRLIQRYNFLSITEID